MCELFGLNLEIHTMATPLLDVANLHVGCAIKNCDFMEVIHPVYRFGLKDKPLDIDDAGYLHLPSGPGLGVTLDWDWIENHTVELITGP
jgi:L-alanine-DL-glutamate epimerase-like enolase superfamily enzyme